MMMEATVTKLIKQYERGGLTRRELVVGVVALAATGNMSLATGQEPQIQPGYSPGTLQSITAVDINHVGINVTDVDRSVGWYTGMFGLKTLVKSKDVAVLGYRDLGANGTTFVLRTSAKPEVNHIMFGINDFDAGLLADYLKAKRLTLRNDVLSFHVKDPDGIDVQVGDKTLHPAETVLTHK
jgi:catechol 2,3-dioxygenase-like lactoylglutathione lyase family enzyme